MEKNKILLASYTHSIFSLSLSKEDFQIKQIYESAHGQKITQICQVDPNFFFSCSHDKTAKLWEESTKECKAQSKTAKKITKAFFKDYLYFCDKYGDIFKLDIKDANQPASHLMGNLATIKVFAPIFFSQKSYLFISDEYSRIKICRFPEIYEILSIWIPYNGIVTSIINFKKSLLLLFEFEKNNPQLHFISEENIENEKFRSVVVDSVLLEGDRTQIFLISEEKEVFGSLEQWENIFSLKIWAKNLLISNEVNDKMNETKEQNKIDEKPSWYLKNEIKGEHKGKMKVRQANEERIIIQENVPVAEEQKESGRKKEKGYETFENAGLKIFYFEL